jgi:glucose-1-phosphate cytidylyltransferase
MKIVILCGGRGSRMGEETNTIPKPMLEIGGKPLLWHIIKHYSFFGYDDFILCLGYKGSVIRNYFINYTQMNYDCELQLDGSWRALGDLTTANYKELDWNIILTDTGLETQTGGRLKRVQKYIGDSSFMCTYGDGVSNVDIIKLLQQHEINKINGALGTVTVVNSTSRYGDITTDDCFVKDFHEKAKINKINGGFFVFEPEVFDFIEGDIDPLETGMLTRLTRAGKLAVYNHNDIWASCDTMKDVIELNALCKDQKPPWQVW